MFAWSGWYRTRLQGQQQKDDNFQDPGQQQRDDNFQDPGQQQKDDNPVGSQKHKSSPEDFVLPPFLDAGSLFCLWFLFFIFEFLLANAKTSLTQFNVKLLSIPFLFFLHSDWSSDEHNKFIIKYIEIKSYVLPLWYLHENRLENSF